jgi:hypothetical protein
VGQINCNKSKNCRSQPNKWPPSTAVSRSTLWFPLLYPSSTSGLEGGECSKPLPGRFTPGKETWCPVVQETEWTSLEVYGKSCPQRCSNPEPSSQQQVASSLAAWNQRCWLFWVAEWSACVARHGVRSGVCVWFILLLTATSAFVNRVILSWGKSH